MAKKVLKEVQSIYGKKKCKKAVIWCMFAAGWFLYLRNLRVVVTMAKACLNWSNISHNVLVHLVQVITVPASFAVALISVVLYYYNTILILAIINAPALHSNTRGCNVLFYFYLAAVQKYWRTLRDYKTRNTNKKLEDHWRKVKQNNNLKRVSKFIRAIHVHFMLSQ